MSWELKNVGWPIPFTDSWPIMPRKPKVQQPTLTLVTQFVPYGKSTFDNQYVTGKYVNLFV